jgi:putative FmdB family regulatory protein
VPTYEYACQSCGHHVEIYQRFTDAPLTVCEICGGPLRKVFHPAGILFKGSGFYSTDSRASAAKANGDSTSSSKKDEGSSTKGTGSTDAAKSTSSAPSSPSSPTSGSKERSA